jgi:hypothetical protein
MNRTFHFTITLGVRTRLCITPDCGVYKSITTPVLTDADPCSGEQRQHCDK